MTTSPPAGIEQRAAAAAGHFHRGGEVPGPLQGEQHRKFAQEAAEDPRCGFRDQLRPPGRGPEGQDRPHRERQVLARRAEEALRHLSELRREGQPSLPEAQPVRPGQTVRLQNRGRHGLQDREGRQENPGLQTRETRAVLRDHQADVRPVHPSHKDPPLHSRLADSLADRQANENKASGKGQPASFFDRLHSRASSKPEVLGKASQGMSELQSKHTAQELSFLNMLGKTAAAFGSLG